MCEFNKKITIAHLLRLTIVSAKSKIYSPRLGYLSPSNSIVLEVAAALLFISVTNSCQFLELILLKLKHAFNRPVYVRGLCTRCGPIVTTDLHSYTHTTRWHTTKSQLSLCTWRDCGWRNQQTQVDWFARFSLYSNWRKCWQVVMSCNSSVEIYQQLATF